MYVCMYVCMHEQMYICISTCIPYDCRIRSCFMHILTELPQEVFHIGYQITFKFHRAVDSRLSDLVNDKSVLDVDQPAVELIHNSNLG